MRKFLLGTALLVGLASPAAAKNGQPYVALEGGVLFPTDPDGGTVAVDYSATQTPASPLAPIPADVTFNNAFGNLNSKTGFDVDFLGGYDFGMFRIEGEIGFKSSKIKSDFDQATIDAINNALNSAGLTESDFDIDNKVNVWSGMLNGLLDFGGEDGAMGVYVGGGVGYANVHALHTSRGAIAWQAVAGIYAPISENVDIGLKVRYFATGNLRNDENFSVTGLPRTVSVGGTPVVQTVSADLFTESSYKYKAFSLLLSLAYNFGAPPPPPPPLPPPPPPPPPPATQTCPDGSAILATDMCPTPPPPPPPPPPAPERG